MKLSIVSTLYKSEKHVSEFCERAAKVARKLVGEDYEIILVDDGSPDESLRIATGMALVEPRLKVVELSRNFGHHKALMTGLSCSRGELVFLIDSDLEEQPEWLLRFSEQMTRERCDVVYGVQRQRKGARFERWSGRLFYSAFNFFTALDLTPNITVVRLMTRCYVDALIRHGESELFLAALWHITGFDQRPQKVDKLSISETTYTLRHKIAMFVNAITSFSSKPLVFIFYIGLTTFMIALCYMSFLVLNWLLFSKPTSGWTSVMASVWLLGGLIICFIGVVGIYISKIFVESKRRPYTIIKNVHGFDQRKDCNDELY